MAKLLKLRRGTTSQHNTFTGAEGEVTIDTTKDTAVVHDGSQAGGRPLAREDMSNVSSASIAGQLGTDSIAVGKIAAGTLPSDVKITDSNVSGNLTIESADIVDGTIVNADVNASAAIAGTKISPNFGSQSILTTGGCDTGNLTVTGQVVARKSQEPQIVLQDSDSGNTGTAAETGISFRDGGGTQQSMIGHSNSGDKDFYLDTAGADHRINFRVGGSTTQLEIESSAVNVTGNLNVTNGVDVTGNMTVTGTVDGRDVAADGSKLDGIDSGAKDDQTKAEIDALNINADQVDGLHASSFVRSDQGDTMNGQYTISTATDEKIILSGSAEPYIRWQEGTTNKAYIQWSSAGYFYLVNQETGEWLRIGSGANGLEFSHDGTTSTVWHSGNDGSGSGLHADLLDGVQGSSYLRSDADDTATRRIVFSNNETDNEDTIATGTSNLGGIEIYNAGAGNDAFMAFHTGSDYAFYFGIDADTNDLAVGGWSMGANKYKIWHQNNDGSGSGLDADTVDGIQGSNFLRSDTADSASGDITFNGGAGAVMINNGSDIRLQSDGSNWTGDYGAKFQHHSNYLYSQGGSSGHIFRNPSGTNVVTIDTSGNLTAQGNVTAYSDARLKTNVNTINDALSIVGKLRGVSFDWKETGKRSIGVIAQEVEQVIPEVVVTTMDPDPVTGESTEVKSVDYGKMVGVLINAINELKAEIEELKGGK